MSSTTIAENFLIASRVLVSGFYLILVIIFFLECWGLTESVMEYFRSEKRDVHKRNNLDMHLLLLGQLCGTFALLTVNMVMLFAVPFANFPSLSCDALAILLACSYAVSPVVYDHGLVISIGMCNDSLREIWVLVILILGTITISGMLSYLFVNPLYVIAQSSETHIREQVKRVLRRNLFLTSIMIISSSVNVGLCTVFWQIVDPNNPSPDNDYYLIFISLGGSLDMFTLCICSRLMTNIWLPIRCRRSPLQVAHHASKDVLSVESSPVPNRPQSKISTKI